jgi:hypothetical protein
LPDTSGGVFPVLVSYPSVTPVDLPAEPEQRNDPTLERICVFTRVKTVWHTQSLR